MRTKRSIEPLPAETVRPYSSMGARGLLRIGFGMTPEHADYPAMKHEFLDNYAASASGYTRASSRAGRDRRAMAARASHGHRDNKATRFTTDWSTKAARHAGLRGLRRFDTTPEAASAPCCSPREAEACSRLTACMSATTCATSRPRARLACSCVAVDYGYHGADNPGARDVETPTDQSPIPGRLLEHL